MTRLILGRAVDAPATIEIGGHELHYLTRVRRKQKGDAVEVRDERGRSFSAVVERIERDNALLRIEKPLEASSPVFPVTLLMAVPKRRLMDDVVRMVSEIGAERLVPTIAERSVVKPGKDKLERWRKIARESLRQCGREGPLLIDAVQPLEVALKAAENGTRLILHPDTDTPFPNAARGDQVETPITVAVGPEGGFTEDEVRLAFEAGFEAVKLGMPILRIETAAVASAVLSVALLGTVPGR
jgi:16S rRNA (uracil1498-N3)-methyltransferase